MDIQRFGKHSHIQILQNIEFRRGFTLVELLVVIAIIAVIIGLVFPNYLSARERARDQKRKSEVASLKNALQLYYHDYSTYPASYDGDILGCGSDGSSNCPICGTSEFAAGDIDGCKTTYMKVLPKINDNYVFEYHECSNGNDYRIITSMENASDPDITVSQGRCPANTCTGQAITYAATDYVLCGN